MVEACADLRAEALEDGLALCSEGRGTTMLGCAGEDERGVWFARCARPGCVSEGSLGSGLQAGGVESEDALRFKSEIGRLEVL